MEHPFSSCARAAATTSFAAILGVLLVSASAVAAELPVPRGKRVLEPLNYCGVRLDEGRLRLQFDEVRDDYLRIPNDDLLKGFRQRAGLPAPGADLGGWYTSDTFHVFGQIVSGLSRMHAATGDPACRDKVNTLLAEWAKCIAPDGFFFYSTKPNARHYIYDKTVCGLVDACLYCRNTDALSHLSRITDWAIKNLERSRRLGDTGTEWYTLSENLYRAYLATGDTKYRDFAEVWEYTEYWDFYAGKADPLGPRPNAERVKAYHAYSHVNTLGGAAAAFIVKGEPRYLDILRNAYDYLQANQVFATGGFGPDEQFLARPELVARLGTTHNTFETQCGCWAAFKMAKQAICLTGDAKYGDWIERLVYNGIGASIHMTPDGRVFYYADYNLAGGAKQNIGFAWSCCTGTRPQAVADYHDLIYFRGADSLYVNLFTPSTVQWNGNGQPVTVRQSTRFPESPLTDLDLDLAQPAEFAIKLRVPGWLHSPLTATVNGQPVSAPADDLHWATIRRTWRSTDRLSIVLPMSLYSQPVDPARPHPAAVLHGPVVLAFRAAKATPLVNMDLAQLDRQLLPSAGESLTWHLAADPSVLARPFYAFQEGQPYLLYLDPTLANRITHRQITFKQDWKDAGRFRYTNVVGATAECAFEGTGIRWLGFRYDDAGTAEVIIDGKVIAAVNQFGPGRDLPFDWSSKDLAPGRHTICLRVLDDKPPQSKDRYINIAGFEVTPAPPPR